KCARHRRARAAQLIQKHVPLADANADDRLEAGVIGGVTPKLAVPDQHNIFVDSYFDTGLRRIAPAALEPTGRGRRGGRGRRRLVHWAYSRSERIRRIISSESAASAVRSRAASKLAAIS